MIYVLLLRNRAARAGVAMGLIGLLLVVGGCASWKMERVSVPTEAKSSGGIEVTPPRVYRDGEGFFVAGNLRGRGLGAHYPGPGHLHAQTTDAEGRVISDTKTAAPYIRHNRHSACESATYTFHLETLPPAGGRLRIVLHRVPLKKCTGLDIL
ncbi:MAG TPA: hypothetical protein VN673_09270 [Clostridia bacterium]|jgi:hypothetical protein|nr:hypothetical protein [Clostridia bacterium]